MKGLGSADIFEFGHFRFDRGTHCLFRLDQRGKDTLVPLGRTALDVLDMLVDRQGEVVEREAIMRKVWRGKTVEDANLAVQISNLRDCIGRRSIQTISGRGYRFVAPAKQPSANAHLAEPLISALVARPRLSIVVLPFTDLSEDRGQQYFADGITDDLTTDLSRFGEMLVISRNTAFTYRDKPVDTKQIGRDLDVRFVLEGSVRRSGKQIRVNAQLIDAEADAHVWAERFDRHLSTLFELQDEITTAIAGAIEPELLKFERDRVASLPQHSEDTYEIYQRGMWYQYRHNKTDNIEAQVYFRRALAMDPQYLRATAHLAIAILHAAFLGWAEDVEGNYAEAYELAQRAVNLDPRYPMAQGALGLVCMWTRRSDRAIAAFQAAIELNPSFAAAHVFLGWIYLYRGCPEEAISLVEKGIRLSPRDPRLFFWLTALGGAHYQLRHYAKAIELGRQSWTLNRNWPAGLFYVIAGLAQLGRIVEAQAPLDELRLLIPNLAFVEDSLQRLYTDRGAVEHILDGLRKAGLT
jgi:TolB-like protein/Tfp pilus assembly protein PilF